MKSYLTCLMLSVLTSNVYAGEVQILHADFLLHNTKWTIAVTLRHADSGWDHYADAWRVVDSRGEILALRNLQHPHEDEQPFTRDLDGVFIAPDQSVVFVEAHDKIHGWGAQRLRVDLKQFVGPGFTVQRN
ncbi:MAG: hypothetical protein OEW08_04980 [Gammaproteobacteria bacterium]|nr:hypothetical protein [Gammaproteobacteria bacterium]